MSLSVPPPPNPIVHPGYVAGRRYNGTNGNPTSIVVPGASISGVPAQRIWLYPEPIPQRIAVNQLGVQLYDTADANGSFMAAIYRSDPASKLPTGMPVLAGANAGPTSMVGIPVNVDLAAPAYQDPGLYWVAFMTNSATARFLGINPAFSRMTNLIGMIGGGNPAAQSGAYAALAFGAAFGAWPDLTGTTEASYVPVAGPYAPAVWSRVPAAG